MIVIFQTKVHGELHYDTEKRLVTVKRTGRMYGVISSNGYLGLGGGYVIRENIEGYSLYEFANRGVKQDVDAALITWAVGRWNEEVRDRPESNVYRRSLDETWRQVIRYAGGDDKMLLGEV